MSTKSESKSNPADAEKPKEKSPEEVGTGDSGNTRSRESTAEDTDQSEIKTEPVKWQQQLTKAKDQQAKKEVEVNEAQDKDGNKIRVNTRILVNNEKRIIVKLTNHNATSIPAKATDENRNQTLEQVSLETPLNEVTLY